MDSKVDSDTANRKFQKELNAGAGALVVLGVLHQSGRPMYGYEIGKLLEERAGGVLPMHHGALYPALRSLEKSGFLTSRVEPSISGPPRRYYDITPAGRAVLIEWTAAWDRTKQFVDSVLEQSRANDHGRKPSRDPKVPDGAGKPPEGDLRPRGGRGASRSGSGRCPRIPAE